MKKNIDGLNSLYGKDEKYEGIINNKAVDKLLDSIKDEINRALNVLENDEEYQLEDMASVSVPATPRVHEANEKVAAMPAGGYKKAL
jgi:hypothetical protein